MTIARDILYCNYCEKKTPLDKVSSEDFTPQELHIWKKYKMCPTCQYYYSEEKEYEHV